MSDAKPATPVPPVTRRERLRDATMAEIKTTARRHLVASGAGGALAAGGRP